jgi:hypothetical protein
VLCAGINDGEELHRTLDWVEAHPSFTSLALVPMGYTRYSKRFSSSFSEDQEASRAVVSCWSRTSVAHGRRSESRDSSSRTSSTWTRTCRFPLRRRTMATHIL